MKPFHMARKILLPAVLLALAIGLAWKQTELAASLPADRVEILADGGASYLGSCACGAGTGRCRRGSLCSYAGKRPSGTGRSHLVYGPAGRRRPDPCGDH